MSSDLTRQREAELTKRWQLERDRAAAEAMVRAHLGLVTAHARRYRRTGAALDDLIGEGRLGLLLALDGFAPERGVPFGAYAALWIRARLTSFARACSLTRPRTARRFARESARVEAEHGTGEAATVMLARRLDVSVERLRELAARTAPEWVPFDAELAERIAAASDQELELSRLESARSLEREIGRVLALLDPRERYIAERRLMVDRADQPSLNELAGRFGVSRERVGQLEARTKRKLRRAIRFVG